MSLTKKRDLKEEKLMEFLFSSTAMEEVFNLDVNEKMEVKTKWGAWETELFPFLSKLAVFHLCSTYKPNFALRADRISRLSFQFVVNFA